MPAVINTLRVAMIIFFTQSAIVVAESVEHKTYKLLREAAINDASEIEIATFSYHQDRVASAAAVEFNYSNCKIVADYLTGLTDKRHWCEEDALVQILDWDNS